MFYQLSEDKIYDTALGLVYKRGTYEQFGQNFIGVSVVRVGDTNITLFTKDHDNSEVFWRELESLANRLEKPVTP